MVEGPKHRKRAKLLEMTSVKSNGHWVNDASAEVNVHRKMFSLFPD